MSKYLLLPFIFIFLISSCGKEAIPPVADFSPVDGGVACTPIGLFSTTEVLADITSVAFENTSTGEIDAYLWEFEDGLSSSNSENAVHTFGYEGFRNVKLTVSGPGGTDTKTCAIRVIAFPLCNGFLETSTYSAEAINFFRDNNLVRNLPKIKVKNTYGNAVTVKIFAPDSWLDGDYDKTRGSRDIRPGKTENINSSNITNEWGIQLTAVNGSISCVRIIGRIGFSNGSDFIIDAKDIADGVL